VGVSTPLNRKPDQVDQEIAEAKRKEDEEKMADDRVLTSNPEP